VNRREEPAALEQEIKFFLPDEGALRRRLADLGAQPYLPRAHETNIRFDTAEGVLTRAGKVLRLRAAGTVILTFKTPEAARSAGGDGAARRLLETEITVDNLEKTAHLLHALGFRPIVRYEKYREVFRWRSALVMLDQLPFGFFCELEGPDLAELQRTAERLGLQWQDSLHNSYMGIFLLLKKKHRLKFLDATFHNFSGWDARKTAEALAALPREGNV